MLRILKYRKLKKLNGIAMERRVIRKHVRQLYAESRYAESNFKAAFLYLPACYEKTKLKHEQEFLTNVLNWGLRYGNQ